LLSGLKKKKSSAKAKAKAKANPAAEEKSG